MSRDRESIFNEIMRGFLIRPLNFFLTSFAKLKGRPSSTVPGGGFSFLVNFPAEVNVGSSMTELHFVGYNGYHQFPDKEKDLPKVITDWTSVAVDGTLSACRHRFVLLETGKFVKIHGILCENEKTLHEVQKPADSDCFGSCDEFLLACKGTSVWKYSYRNLNWIKLVYSFACPDEKSAWEETGNRISKFSFQQNHTDVIILLNNGSVWLLSEEGCLKLLYPCDIDKAIDVSSGLEHSLILTESGCVLTFGNGSRGQLGHGDLDPTPQPVQVPSLEGLKVTKMAAGGWHSCAVTDSGDLYTWGWNNYGQLSAFEEGREMGLTALPVLVDVDDSGMKVVDVACGRRHTMAALENGGLFATGWNRYKQLGIGTLEEEKVSKFTKCTIEGGRNATVICGPWYTILSEKLPE